MLLYYDVRKMIMVKVVGIRKREDRMIEKEMER